MKTSNFPGKVNRRRIIALNNLTKRWRNERKVPEYALQEMRILTQRINPSANFVRTKKDRSERGRMRKEEK